MIRKQIEAGQRWIRKVDGVEVEVDQLGGDAHSWVDVHRTDNGRLITVSEVGFRKRYFLKRVSSEERMA